MIVFNPPARDGGLHAHSPSSYLEVIQTHGGNLSLGHIHNVTITSLGGRSMVCSLETISSQCCADPEVLVSEACLVAAHYIMSGYCPLMPIVATSLPLI